MNRFFVAAVIATLVGGAAIGLAQSAPSGAQPPAASASGLDLAAIDRSADPCADFFQYACGGWVAAHPIPADRPRWGTFDELQERNLAVLRGVLEAAAPGRNPATKQIGDYYATCLDEPAIEAKGAMALAPLLRKIARLDTVRGLPALLAELHTVGAGGFFGFGAEADFKDAKTVIAIADQGGMGLPDRDYYFRDDQKSIDLRAQYLAHVAKMATLAGASNEAAQSEAQAVMRIETALAKGALDRVSRRDPTRVYHKLTPAALQALTPAFTWTTYFRGTGAPPIRALNVTEPDFFTALNAILASTPVDDLKAYLRWHVVHASAPMLSKAFVDENFAFYSATLQGVTALQPRWKRCVQYTDGDLGEALGQAFVREAFGGQAKADTLTMVRGLETALETDIRGLSWMTDATKAQAVAKLHAISEKIGYPDRWRDYRGLSVVRGDALGNSQRANAFEFHRQMRRIDTPVDKSEWDMTPPTVNAYYNALQNNVNFPAGILQRPFYSATADAAVNYGGAGAVVGHELTHGFDDEGRQFDSTGNLRDWWTPEDGKAFEGRTQCLVNQYAAYSPIEGVALNGQLTLGENTADNGGVRLALMAYLGSAAAATATSLDGFSPEQRLFLGFGQIWCESRRPEYERLQAQTNPHSPGRYRVNGVVSNMPEFLKAFGCKADAPMARAETCKVW